MWFYCYPIFLDPPLSSRDHQDYDHFRDQTLQVNLNIQRVQSWEEDHPWSVSAPGNMAPGNAMLLYRILKKMEGFPESWEEIRGRISHEKVRCFYGPLFGVSCWATWHVQGTVFCVALVVQYSGASMS